MAIDNVLVGDTDTDLLLVPANERRAVTNIMVCNTAVPDPTDPEQGKTNFDLHFVKSGEPKGNVNKVINRLDLPAGETFTFDSEKIVLEAGDRVVIVSEAPTNLSATISWLEV
jgi:hypothetical protein